MNAYKIIAIGDNVCDKYLSRKKMYPGGQCVNTCVYATMNGASAAYLGKYGNDEVAGCVRETLKTIGVDDSHCRVYEGENGFALVTLKDSDRVFLGSNKGGIAAMHPFYFDTSDFDYIRQFHVIYTNLNSYIENDLKALYDTGVPVAYDFSWKWTDDYLKKVCPFVTLAMMSCAHLSDEQRENEMKKANALGVKIVLGTVGEAGSYVLYDNDFYYMKAVRADNIIDTMGAGDSYFAAFMCDLLKNSREGNFIEGTKEQMKERLLHAMAKGAGFAANVCAMEGAFGYGVPIAGRTKI